MTQHFFGDVKFSLTNGISGIPLQITTANPAHFYQLISERASMPSTQIWAQLFLPESTAPTPRPAVIVVPGSMGVAPSHIKKAVLLTDAGIAALVLDPFGSRGVSTTVANQAQYSFAASAWDVLAAADLLRNRSDIHPGLIGAQGHSRGGSAVLSAARLGRLIPDSAHLHSVYAAYPWCGQQFVNPHVGLTRVRSVIGDQDEWCLPQQVQAHMQALQLCGCAASFRIFAGAHHSFDRETPVELVADASVAPGAPTTYIEDDGSCIHPLTGESKTDFSERELMLYGIKAGYGQRGAKLGTSGDLADQFHSDMMTFWQQMRDLA